MKRKLLLLNIVLLALVVALGYDLRRRWRENRAREEAVLRLQIKPSPAPLAPPVEAIRPIAPAGYEEVAQKMLFSRDRNPNVEIVVAPPQPMPPLPPAYGFMNLGGTPTVILGEKPGVQRAFRPGDPIGPFKLLSVDGTDIVFEWEGKKIGRKLSELIEQGRKSGSAAEGQPVAVASAAPPAAAASTTSTSTTITASTPEKSGPGVSVGADARACQPGDNSPAGTVKDGFRKVMTDSPFGKLCRWEPAK